MLEDDSCTTPRSPIHFDIIDGGSRVLKSFGARRVDVALTLNEPLFQIPFGVQVGVLDASPRKVMQMLGMYDAERGAKARW